MNRIEAMPSLTRPSRPTAYFISRPVRITLLVTLLDKVSCGVILHFDQPADPTPVPFPSDWLIHLLPVLVRLSHDLALSSDAFATASSAPSRYKNLGTCQRQARFLPQHAALS